MATEVNEGIEKQIGLIVMVILVIIIFIILFYLMNKFSSVMG
jgi:cytochrome c1